MDRGYFDFRRLQTIHTEGAFFIIRSKESLSFQRIYSFKVDKKNGLRCDQTIRLKHFYAHKKYPQKLRRIKYYDEQTDKQYVYLTNNFGLSANTITELYRNRWQIENFFSNG